MTKQLLALVALLIAAVQPAHSVEPWHGIGSDFIGNDQTLLYIQALTEAVALDQSQIRTRLWFDPYTGNDSTGNGTYTLPYRSFEKMKLACISYTRCTVKGKGLIFSPLTLAMDATTIALGETYYPGEAVSGTWNGGSGTGTVLDWDPVNNILVLARTSAGSTDPIATNIITAANPTRSVTVTSVTNTIDPVGIQTVTFTAGATDRANLTAHGFVNGQGPLYFNTTAALPSLGSGTFTAGTAYYACAVAANDFQIGNSTTCASVLDLTDTGSGTNSVNYAPASFPGINPGCDNKDKVCIVFDSEFADSPFVIDGNRFHTTNSQNGPGGLFLVNDEVAYGGFVLIQNAVCQNIANDCWSTSPGGNPHVIALNTRAIDVRNGSENRTDTIANNNCYTTHGPSGVLYVINSRQSESRVDEAGGAGGCIAPTNSNKLVVLNGGPFTSQSAGGSNWARSIAATGGDIVVVNSHLMGGTTVWYGGILYDISGSFRGRIQLARVLFQSRFAANTGQHLAIDNDTSDQPIDVTMHEVTFAGRGQALYLDALGAPVTVTGQELLADNVDYWVATQNATSSVRFTTLDLRGVYDDEDAGGGDANEWFDGAAAYATRATFVAAMSAIDASWNAQAIFGRNSANSGDGADGTDWGTDTASYRCASTGKCWKAAIAEPPYLIDFRSIYSVANDKDETCLPAEIAGQKLCGLSLKPVNYGAR